MSVYITVFYIAISKSYNLSSHPSRVIMQH